MRRGVVHTLAWLLATGAAVALSWWGVHTVLSGTVHDPPRALPVEQPAQASDPWASSTPRGDDRPAAAKPSRSPGASPADRAGAGPSPGTASPPAGEPSKKPSADTSRAARSEREPRADAAGTPAPSSSGEVRSYSVAGGRVVLDLTPARCDLVTATPAAGWKMQVWTHPSWLRVTFGQGGRESTVMCSWHQHAPLVETDESSS